MLFHFVIYQIFAFICRVAINLVILVLFGTACLRSKKRQILRLLLLKSFELKFFSKC